MQLGRLTVQFNAKPYHDMDGQVQRSLANEDVQKEPEWKVTYRRIYNRLFGWWEAGVPPTWLVIVGCLVVQVRQLASKNICTFMYACKIIIGSLDLS